MPRVLVVATSRKTRGGITSVVKAHETGAQWKKYHCRWIETHRGGYKWRKIVYFLTGFTQFIALVPWCDIVHMHVSYAGSLKRGCAIMRISKFFHKKTVVHFHPPGPEVLRDKRNHDRYNYLFDNADIVLVLSPQWHRWIYEILGPKKNLKILYNPCPAVNRIASIEKRKQILLAGFVVLRKGYDTVLHAFARIAKKYPEWRVAFAGIGDIEDGKRIATELGIAGQVDWLGWIGGKDKEKLFNESSIYCLASTGEGFPMAVLDAWSYGLPCVMTPVGGIPDIVRDGIEGLIFPVGNPVQLAELLERLIIDEELRKKIVASTDVYVNGAFNIQTINKQLETIYDKLIDERKDKSMQKLTVEQVKEIELDILIDFADFCDRHDLKYFLGYGTLLGAVRHHGFIPWDDDIDVMMLREDYEKFHKLMEHECVRKDLQWCSIENNKYHAPFGKLVNTNTTAGIYGGRTGNGLWIDVFAIDNYTKENYEKNFFWRRVLIARDTHRMGWNKKGLAKMMLKTFFCWKSVKSIATNIRERAVATPYTGKVANMVWPTYRKEILDVELFAETSDVEFEGHTFKTVKRPNEYLSLCYGDYMKLPPIEKRVAHYVEAYWCGSKPFKSES